MIEFKSAHPVPRMIALVVLGIIVALYEFLIITAEPAHSFPVLVFYLAIGLIAASLITKGILTSTVKNTEDNTE